MTRGADLGEGLEALGFSSVLSNNIFKTELFQKKFLFFSLCLTFK